MGKTSAFPTEFYGIDRETAGLPGRAGGFAIVKKAGRSNDAGKEDSVKETQEGCLSRSIIKFFEQYASFSCSKNFCQRGENKFSDTLPPAFHGRPAVSSFAHSGPGRKK